MQCHAPEAVLSIVSFYFILFFNNKLIFNYVNIFTTLETREKSASLNVSNLSLGAKQYIIFSPTY